MKKDINQSKRHKFLRFKWTFFLIVLGALCGFLFVHHFRPHTECDFFRNGQCVTCATNEDFPVGYRENCSRCPNKKAHYIEGGLVEAWLCSPDSTELEGEIVLEKDNTPCATKKEFKDIVGNCCSCDTEEPVRLMASGVLPCQQQRYFLPDNLALKSLKCPTIQGIHDPEVCFSCRGIWNGDECTNMGQNLFCEKNSDCPAGQWCFPFKRDMLQKGLCTKRSDTKWICSQTDGYDLKTAQDFCWRQNAHIPTLDEIAQVDEDLSELCPTLDMWTFFAPDGVVWMESFTQEFLFTREGETERLGGHQFYALCHKD